MTIGFTLIATRAIAEALHGYIYGNEDWDDEDLVNHGQIGFSSSNSTKYDRGL